MVHRQDNKLRIGILGCSDIASRKFLPALLGSQHAVLAAVASRDRDRAKGFVPGRAYAALTYDELMDGGDADLVYISLPNHLHEEWVLRALESGKHVLCEKPLGLNSASVHRMIDAARKRGLLLAENIMFVHHRQHQVVRDLLTAGRIGRLRQLRTSFGFLLHDRGNFRLDPARGGGVFHDLLRYPLAAARMFLSGDLVEVAGFRLNRGGLNVGMHGYGMTDDGALFDFSVSFDQHYESYYELVGERGKIRIDRAFTTPPELANIIQLSVGTEHFSVLAPADDHFSRMIEHAALLISDGKRHEEEYAQAAWLAVSAELVWKSCRDVALKE
jgi:NDP-hexose-3-ketoreductase